jgi:UDP-N-acetylglucosamine--N-acetylmuramyl-(pentapeptide) pyrophosphoryl-undecaprenol N-acetylglucosamine transferase
VTSGGDGPASERAPAPGSDSTSTVLFAGGGTGGHLYPALAIARTLVRLAPSVRPFLVGARRGIEQQVLPQQSFAYELLDLHPVYRPAVWRNWRTLRGVVGSWSQLGAIAARERPRLVVGTGGYASGLPLAHAVVHSIPIVQQIADSHPGITARLFARYCRECYLGYPEATRFLAARKGGGGGGGGELIDTGNPIEPPIEPRPNRRVTRGQWGLTVDATVVLLVFGGSQGSRALNQAVDGWVARGLPDGVALIWATGQANYEQHAQRESSNVRVRPYLSPIADAYAAADMALTRAGAMTTAELCAWGIPMVLVPLPSAAANHQTANARALEAAGAAIHLPQAELTSDRIGSMIEALANDPARRDRISAAALARGRPGAAETIARRILSLIEFR